MTRRADITRPERERANRSRTITEIELEIVGRLRAAGIDTSKFIVLVSVYPAPRRRDFEIALHQTPVSFEKDGPVAIGPQRDAAYGIVEAFLPGWMHDQYQTETFSEPLPYEGNGPKGRRIPGRSWTASTAKDQPGPT